MKSLTYAIIGSGAVGGAYGAVLRRSGCDVHFLLRSSYPHVKEKGMTIHANGKTSRISPKSINIYQDVSKMPACDAVIVALKTTQNKSLADLLVSTLVRPDTLILTMQNGLGSEEDIAGIVKSNPILTATTTIAAAQKKPGEIDIKKLGIVKFAPFNFRLEENETARTVIENFADAGVTTEQHDNYLDLKWKKLLWNMVFNGLCVTHEKTAGRIAIDYTDLVRDLGQEVINIAAAYGVTITPEYLQGFIDDAKERLVEFEPSMSGDFKKRTPMEIGHIYGNPIEAADAKNVACPLLKGLYKELQSLEKQNIPDGKLDSTVVIQDHLSKQLAGLK